MESSHATAAPRVSGSVPAKVLAASVRPVPAHGRRANHLLAALPDTDFMEWLADLEPVDLKLGQVLFESGRGLSHAYFPTTAMVSLMQLMEDGGTCQSALVGNEGMVGVPVFMGGLSTPGSAVVSTAGEAFRLCASTLRRSFERCGPVTHLLLRYTQSLIAQMAQNAVCNRHHVVEQQLCRSLLQQLDRLSGNEIVVTQAGMSDQLGVRRESITAAVNSLQKLGLLITSRGHIFVRDRVGLERRACECYAMVRKESDRLLPDEVAN